MQQNSREKTANQILLIFYHWKCIKNFVEKTGADIYLRVYSDCILAYLEHEDQCVHRRGSSA